MKTNRNPTGPLCSGRPLTNAAQAHLQRLVRTMGFAGVQKLLHSHESTLTKAGDGLPLRVAFAERLEAKLAELEQKGAG